MTYTEPRAQLANTILLPGESRDAFLAQLDHFTNTFQPVTGVEHLLVADMTFNFWRKLRLTGLEQFVFRLKMDAQAENNPGVGHGINAAQAALELALTGANCLDMIGRWHTRSQKMLDNNARLFLRLRKELTPRDDWEHPASDSRAAAPNVIE